MGGGGRRALAVCQLTLLTAFLANINIATTMAKVSLMCYLKKQDLTKKIRHCLHLPSITSPVLQTLVAPAARCSLAAVPVRSPGQPDTGYPPIQLQLMNHLHNPICIHELLPASTTFCFLKNNFVTLWTIMRSFLFSTLNPGVCVLFCRIKTTKVGMLFN